MEGSLLSPKTMTAPADAEADHPVLQELKKVDPSVSFSRILNHLLLHGVVSAENLRTAHQAVNTSSSTNVRCTTESMENNSEKQQSESQGQKETVDKQEGKGSNTRSNNNNKKKTKSRTLRSPSRPLRCRRHVALQIYYDGSKYSGFAENVGHEADQSVERALFHALCKASFVDARQEEYNNSCSNNGKPKGKTQQQRGVGTINTKPMREQCQYSRCGRTDRGVSAAGQVVALTLPSAFAPDASWDDAGQCLVFSPQQQQQQQETATMTPCSDETVQGVGGACTAKESSNNAQTLPSNSHDSVQVWIPIKAGKKQGKNAVGTQSSESASMNPEHQQMQMQRKPKTMTEYPYDYILNNLLPPDIRVLGWTPVTPDFSARFSATTRTYRYFFLSRQVSSSSSLQQPQHHNSAVMEKEGETLSTAPAAVSETRMRNCCTNSSNMNLAAMRKALSYFVGEHDFRNFCKMDVEKVYNFKRIIHSAELVEINESNNANSMSSGRNATVCYFQIVGQAFLWHQIRCIVSVLFMIGRGLEEPEVVQELLNVTKYPGKPSYAMADEAPLVLHHCGYRNLQMGYSVSNLCKLMTQQEGQWQDLVLQAARIRNNIQTLEQHAQVRVADVMAFGANREEERRKRIQKYSHKSGGRRFMATTTATGSEVNELEKMPHPPPFASLEFVSWGKAREWLEIHGLIPELYALQKQGDGSGNKGGGESNLVHVPLLQRAKGTTYEEKVASLQQCSSSKRRGRYEENIIKKRKTKEEDQAFYDHMTKQGGSAAS